MARASDETAGSVELKAVVVVTDELDHLRPCLERLRSLPMRVIDLSGSESVRLVADQMGAEVVPHPPVSYVEPILMDIYRQIDATWILRLDPDERISPEAISAIVDNLDCPEEVGGMRIPRQYYFRGRPLRGSAWGSPGYVDRVIRHAAVDRSVPPGIHDPWHLPPDMRWLDLECPPIAHLWASSAREILRKHRRYTPVEGENWHRAGRRWRLTSAARSTVRAGLSSLRRMPDRREAPTVALLSLVWMKYEWDCWWALRHLQRSVR